jgi:hypothetical protein
LSDPVASPIVDMPGQDIGQDLIVNRLQADDLPVLASPFDPNAKFLGNKGFVET